MANGENVHVVLRNDGWAVRKEGTSKAISVHKTQSAAVQVARKIARKQSSQLVIHRRDGRVRERESYGHDPLPPRAPEVLFPNGSPSASKKAIRDAVAAAIQKFKNNSKAQANSPR